MKSKIDLARRQILIVTTMAVCVCGFAVRSVGSEGPTVLEAEYVPGGFKVLVMSPTENGKDAKPLLVIVATVRVKLLDKLTLQVKTSVGTTLAYLEKEHTKKFPSAIDLVNKTNTTLTSENIDTGDLAKGLEQLKALYENAHGSE